MTAQALARTMIDWSIVYIALTIGLEGGVAGALAWMLVLVRVMP